MSEFSTSDEHCDEYYDESYSENSSMSDLEDSSTDEELVGGAYNLPTDLMYPGSMEYEYDSDEDSEYGAGRAPSEYNIFFAKKRKGNRYTAKQIGEMWRKTQKGKQAKSKRSGSKSTASKKKRKTTSECKGTICKSTGKCYIKPANYVKFCVDANGNLKKVVKSTKKPSKKRVTRKRIEYDIPQEILDARKQYNKCKRQGKSYCPATGKCTKVKRLETIMKNCYDDSDIPYIKRPKSIASYLSVPKSQVEQYYPYEQIKKKIQKRPNSGVLYYKGKKYVPVTSQKKKSQKKNTKKKVKI